MNVPATPRATGPSSLGEAGAVATAATPAADGVARGPRDAARHVTVPLLGASKGKKSARTSLRTEHYRAPPTSSTSSTRSMFSARTMLQPPPGVEATRRQSREPQQRPQWHNVTGPIHGVQDPDFVASDGQTLVRQGESRASNQSDGEPKECRELFHASPERQDFSLEFRCRPVRRVNADDDARCRAEPAPGPSSAGRQASRDGHVPSDMDEIPKAVIVALLKAARCGHAADHRSSANPTQ